MNVVSLKFIGFIVITAVLYFAVHKDSWQRAVLLAASLLFYATFGWKPLLYMLSVSVLTFFAAIRLEAITADAKERAQADDLDKEAKKAIKEEGNSRKKLIKTIVVVVVLGVWGISKIIVSAANPGWVLPLGLSFFSFTTISYLIDVNRGKYSAEKNFLKYLLFVSYFPHIIQGPFSRYDELPKTLFAQHRFSFDRFSEGARRMLWGYAKKAVLADTLAICVNTVIRDYAQLDGCVVLCGALLYGVQLYADFSGYMDIMCGFSQILGIKLSENFRQPYFSCSIDEFWRRWHFTLGDWSKDYMFYPISLGPRAQKIGKFCRSKFGTRLGKLAPSYYAIIFVWTFTGFWHGAVLNQMVWGWLNMIVIIIGMEIGENKLPKVVKMIHTYLLLTFIRLFCIPPTMGESVGMLKRIITHFNLSTLIHNPTYAFINLKMEQIVLVCLGIAALFTVDLLQEKGKWADVRDRSVLLKNVAAVILLFAIVLFAGPGGDVSTGFMYAVF